MGKKILVLFFALMSVFLSAALLVPVFFDANKYVKPYLEKAISDHLDARAEIGNLSLSLWGKLSVKITNFEIITNKNSQNIFHVDNAKLEAPLLPLLRREANVTFVATKPKILIAKEKVGLNWVRLLKNRGAQKGASAESSANSGPALVAALKFNVTTLINDARIKYRDEKSNDTDVTDVDFELRNFSLDRPFNYKLTARVNSQQEALRVSGPVIFDGSMKILTDQNEYRGFETAGKMDLDGLELKSGALNKAAEKPLHFSFTGTVFTDSAKFKIDSNIESIVAKARAEVQSFNPLKTRIEILAPKIDFADLMQLNLKLSDLSATIQIIPGLIAINDSRFKVYKGDCRGSGSIRTDSKSGNVIALAGKFSDVDINEAIAEQFPEFKNTLSGRLSSDYKIDTSGKKSDDYKRNLRGFGFLTLKEGEWSALYALKAIGEKLSSLPGAKEKIGELKIGDKIQLAESKYKIANEKIDLAGTKIEMKDTRISVMGDGAVGFNKEMKFKGFILAPLGSPPPSLKSSDGRTKLPIEFSGKVNGPKVNWNITTDAVAKAFLKQEGEKLLDHVKDQIKDQNLKNILNKAPEGLDKLIKDIKL